MIPASLPLIVQGLQEQRERLMSACDSALTHLHELQLHARLTGAERERTIEVCLQLRAALDATRKGAA